MQSLSPRAVTSRPVALRPRPVAAVALLFLAIQFLAGMVVNLYVQIPAAHPGAQAPEYFSGVARGIGWALVHGAVALRVHVALGLLLMLSALAVLGLAIRLRQRAWIIASVLGLMGVLAAGFKGRAS